MVIKIVVVLSNVVVTIRIKKRIIIIIVNLLEILITVLKIIVIIKITENQKIS